MDYAATINGGTPMHFTAEPAFGEMLRSAWCYSPTPGTNIGLALRWGSNAAPTRRDRAEEALVSIATWVEAVGTAGATLIAAGALAVQQYDRRRDIGSAVNGWTKIEEGFVTHIVLSNASRVPVYDVIARVVFNGVTIAVTSPDTLRPGHTGEDPVAEPVGIWACMQDLNVTEQGPKVALVFRDPSGRVWRKRSDGQLRRQRRKYNWAEEYQRAMMEMPPPLPESADGIVADAPYERLSPSE